MILTLIMMVYHVSVYFVKSKPNLLDFNQPRVSHDLNSFCLIVDTWFHTKSNQYQSLQKPCQFQLVNWGSTNFSMYHPNYLNSWSCMIRTWDKIFKNSKWGRTKNFILILICEVKADPHILRNHEFSGPWV